MAEVQEKAPAQVPLEKRRRIAAFLAGILLAALAIVAGLYLNPEEATTFTAGRYQLLFIGLFIGVSTGHYIGIALGENRSVNVAAADGAFLTIFVAFIGITFFGSGLSGLIGPVGILVISTFLLILGHYSRLIVENEPIQELVDQFAERYSPLLLAFIWLVEALLPPILNLALPAIGMNEIGGALLAGIKIGGVIVSIFAVVKLIEWWESHEDAQRRWRRS